MAYSVVIDKECLWNGVNTFVANHKCGTQVMYVPHLVKTVLQEICKSCKYFSCKACKILH